MLIAGARETTEGNERGKKEDRIGLACGRLGIRTPALPNPFISSRIHIVRRARLAAQGAHRPLLAGRVGHAGRCRRSASAAGPVHVGPDDRAGLVGEQVRPLRSTTSTQLTDTLIKFSRPLSRPLSRPFSRVFSPFCHFEARICNGTARSGTSAASRSITSRFTPARRSPSWPATCRASAASGATRASSAGYVRVRACAQSWPAA